MHYPAEKKTWGTPPSFNKFRIPYLVEVRKGRARRRSPSDQKTHRCIQNSNPGFPAGVQGFQSSNV